MATDGTVHESFYGREALFPVDADTFDAPATVSTAVNLPVEQDRWDVIILWIVS